MRGAAFDEGDAVIAVVDYRKGNVASVQRSLIAAGADARITSDCAQIASAEAIVLPGVGAFADAAREMSLSGQMEVVRQRIDRGVPFLGICLGLHLLFERGVEGTDASEEELDRMERGLGVAPGVVLRMPDRDVAGRVFKVPHVGWNQVDFARGGSGFERESSPCDGRSSFFESGDASNPALFDGVASGENFYFTHSYIAPSSPFTCATATHSVEFPAVVRPLSHVFGVQFHPEKSSDAGAVFMRNFVQFVKRAS